MDTVACRLLRTILGSSTKTNSTERLLQPADGSAGEAACRAPECDDVFEFVAKGENDNTVDFKPPSVVESAAPERSARLMQSVITVSNLSKTYKSGFKALKNVDLQIREGEIFALLGPNGAGKTTLISIICGIVNASEGSVTVAGYDIVRDYRQTRSLIGLVPQELTTEIFETVWATATYSRGLFGKPANPDHIAKVLKDLSLYDRKDSRIRTLSGGMKRRVLIAKALAHEPMILFLDEPTAGVDVELRKDMWEVVRRLRDSGVTIILTTHYIDEAEELADRIGVINHGELVLVEEKRELMRKLGKKQLTLELHTALETVPAALEPYKLELGNSGSELTYTYDTQAERTGITSLLKDLSDAGIRFRDLNTKESSLEEIFVSLVKRQR
jgi:ABC-2 type transport system ATP-binding protein